MFKKLFVIAAILAISACGTGQNAGSNTASGNVSLFITDNLTQVYSEVWVTILEVEANATDGNSITLYENKTGAVFNLAELSGIGELLNTQAIPAGTYDSFEIKLAKAVNLVTKTGVTETRTFATPGKSNALHIKVPGTITVNADQTTTIALDFDLNQFTLNDAGSVVPVVKFVKDINAKFKQALAKVHGIVTDVTDTGFTLQSPNGVFIQVANGTNTIIVNEAGAAITSVAVGDNVKVRGVLNTDNTVVEAYTVVLFAPKTTNDEDHASNNGLVEVKGIVSAVDGTTITLDIKHADFVPDMNTITVSIETTTVFTRGANQVLEVGQEVEIKGTIVNDVLLAKVVEIEGAGCHNNALNAYAKIEGTVVTSSADMITLTVSKANNVDVTINQEFLVDLANVTIKHGTAASLVVNTKVEIKGTVDPATKAFVPVVVKIKNSLDDMDENENGALELKGQVVSVDATQITVKIAASEHTAAALVGQDVSFALDTTTVFVHQVSPAVNDIVNIYALENNGAYSALAIKVSSLPATPFLAEIKGTVVAITASDITVTVISSEHLNTPVTVAQNITLPLDANVAFEHLTQPAVGDVVEIKVLQTQETLTAKQIEVKRTMPQAL